MLAVPVRRAGRTLGVLVVQNRTPRHYTDDEVDELETVAMLLAEMLPASGADRRRERRASAATVPRVFAGTPLTGGIAIGPVVLHGRAPRPPRLLADDPAAELRRLDAAVERMQRGLTSCSPTACRAAAPRTPRPRARCWKPTAWSPPIAGWLRRVSEVIRGGVTAEAAVQRVAGELHDRMRRISDPYLRERLADLEDLANRLLSALARRRRRAPTCRTAPSCWPAAWARPSCSTGTRAASPAWRSRRPAPPATPRSWRAPSASRRSAAPRGVLDSAEPGDEAVVDADEGAAGPAPGSRGARRPTTARWRRAARSTPAGRRCATARPSPPTARRSS